MFGRRGADLLDPLIAGRPTTVVVRDVRIRASATDLRIPGHNQVSRAVRLHRGSAAVGDDHLWITYRRFVAIDAGLHDDPDAPSQVHFAADGLRVVIDLTAALRSVPGKNSGTAEILVPVDIAPDLLARLPSRAVAISAGQVSAISRRI